MSAARRLADKKGLTVSAVVFGSGVKDESLAPLAHYGANKVIVLDDASLENYTSDAYGHALLELIEKHAPKMLMFVNSSMGIDLAPVLAESLNVGLITDVLAIEESGDTLSFVRPPYSGKVLEKCCFVNEEALKIITVRPKAMDVNEPDESRSVSVVREAVSGFGDIRQIVKDIIQKVSERVELTEASYIVSGGRGVKGPEGFKPLEELADTMGAAVGASRVAVDEGWIPRAHQVGQTGKTVRPNVYFAIGISGAIQHVAGMEESDIIVAINKDEDAPIFDVADYGVVGDLNKIVPALTEAIKAELANK